MPYLVIETAPQYPCDSLITYLTAELGAILTSGPFGDAPNSKGLSELLSHTPAFTAYEPAIRLSARLERQMRLKRIWNNDHQWLIDTDGLIGAMMDVSEDNTVWPLDGSRTGVKEGMRFVLRANTDVLADFSCLLKPELTVCIRPDDVDRQKNLDTAIEVWKELFPDSPVMVVDPEVDYKTILRQLGQ